MTFVSGEVLISAVVRAGILTVFGAVVSFLLAKYVGRLTSAFGIAESKTFEHIALGTLFLVTLGVALTQLPALTNPSFLPLSETGSLINSLVFTAMVLAVPISVFAVVPRGKK